MQITADISKIWRTVQRDLIFIFDVLFGSAISFVSFFGSLGCRKCFQFHIKWFFSKTRRRNNAQLCRNVQGHLRVQFSVYFFVYLLPLKSSVFVVQFSNVFYNGKEALPKHGSQTKIVPLLVIFDLIQLIKWF